MDILNIIGLVPVNEYSLIYPIIALAIWLLFLIFAYLRGISIFYNSSLKAAFIEELFYRGILYGLLLYFWSNQFYALLGSSLLFGIAHLKNIWWAGWRRSIKTSMYAGFRAGPIFGLIRLISGDIYLGILVHFLHNLLVMFPPPGLERYMARTPTNSELRSK